eukprot:12876286-Heterocapsa_arctica.AAC.1
MDSLENWRRREGRVRAAWCAHETTPAAVRLRAYKEACGETLGCAACVYGTSGRSHYTACLKRQIAWETKRKAEVMEEKETPMEKRQRVGEMEATKKRPRENIENEEVSDEKEDQEARTRRSTGG